MFASKRFASAVMIAAASVVLASCAQDSDNAQNAVASGSTFEFITPGGQQEIFYEEADRKPLQSFSGESLTDDSETISLDDFEGEIVVLNSWGQWCAPGVAEVYDRQRIQEVLEERDLGTVLGINVRDYNPQIARDFKEDNGVTFPSIYDPPFRTAAALGGVPTSVVPTTIVLDSQHRPAAVFLRGITDKDILDVIDDLEQEQAS